MVVLIAKIAGILDFDFAVHLQLSVQNTILLLLAGERVNLSPNAHSLDVADSHSTFRESFETLAFGPKFGLLEALARLNQHYSRGFAFWLPLQKKKSLYF